jgi:4-aminobutyrate aminotransferase/(S)-3-amino-2-methylpropionate transaminase
VAPDLVTMAKSMAGGFPIAAVIGRASAMDAAPAGGLGSTYAGHPLACAAALAVLEVFDEEKLLDRAKAVGARLAAGLGELARRQPSIRDVRAHGAMVAIEMFKNGDLHQPDADLTKRVCAEALKRGLILLSCGVYGNVIRILVPLTVPDHQIDEALAILGQSFDAAQG